MEQDKVSIEKSDLTSVMILLKFATKYWFKILLTIIIITISAAFLTLSARYLGFLVEALTKPETLSLPLQIIIIYLICELGFVGLRFAGSLWLNYISTFIIHDIRVTMFNHSSVMPMSYYDRQPMGRSITRLTSDVEGIEQFFVGSLNQFVGATLNIIMVVIAMFVTNPRLAWISVLSALPALLFVLTFKSQVKILMRAYRKANAVVLSKFSEFINGIKFIHAYKLQNWSRKIFDSSVLEQYTIHIRLMTLNSLIRPMATFLCAIPIFTVMYFGGMGVLENTLNIGIFVAFIRYCERFYWPIQVISHQIHIVQEAITSSERVKQLLKEKTEQELFGKDGAIEDEIIGQIEFKNVSMGYINDQKVLKNLTFNIEPGKKLGLVGRTGSGKSSTVNLIPRLYPYQEGQILIDQQPIENYSRHKLRSQIGLVNQEVILFPGTIRQNLLATYKGDLATVKDEQILKACRDSGFDKTLETMPDKLQTEVIEGGKNLSVGQRQMLSITRLFLQSPKILILDEATSNIDYASEKLVHKAMDRLMNKCTCLIIAHRMKTIESCDQLLVFRDGKIHERGSPSELLSQESYFSKLYHLQNQG